MKSLYLALCLALLASCSSLRQQDAAPKWQFSGKFSLRSPQLNQTGYISWHQYEGYYKIKLWGALGFGTTIITGDKNYLTVDNGKQQQTYSNDEAATLFAGVELPIASIANNTQLLRQGATGQTQTLPNSLEWHVSYLKTKVFNEVERPSKLRISDGVNQLTLLIKDWQ